MADHYKELQGLGVEVYAVSTNSHFVHKAWHDFSTYYQQNQIPMWTKSKFDEIIKNRSSRGDFFTSCYNYSGYCDSDCVIVYTLFTIDGTCL